MSTVYVTEFASISKDHDGRVVPAAEVPVLATQTISVSGTSAAVSNDFNAKTRVVRIHTDIACSIVFAGTPVATTSDMRLPAGAIEYFTLSESEVANGLKVAAISN